MLVKAIHQYHFTGTAGDGVRGEPEHGAAGGAHGVDLIDGHAGHAQLHHQVNALPLFLVDHLAAQDQLDIGVGQARVVQGRLNGLQGHGLGGLVRVAPKRVHADAGNHGSAHDLTSPRLVPLTSRSPPLMRLPAEQTWVR